MTEDTKTPAESSPFWRFSLGFYRHPEVAAACIELQDQAGVDVNVLFFLLWNATLKRTLAADAIADLDRRIGEWRNATVVPLREVRRALKSPPAVIEPGTVEAFRTRIKGVELEAERLQQQALYDLVTSLAFGAAVSSEDAARANVAAYQAAMPRAFPRSAVDTILAAFARRESRAAGIGPASSSSPGSSR